ncbi:hypothetical protein SDC9_169591 [bioreactor metagenome]|uniref:Uncharacterized protein n=1 Tax=bioreactor metagenome TaxID=1076179 RepID=A0A645G5R1_9ZZZZ
MNKTYDLERGCLRTRKNGINPVSYMDLQVFCKLVPEQNPVSCMNKSLDIAFNKILTYPHNTLFSFRVNPLNRNPFGIVPVFKRHLANIFGGCSYNSLFFGDQGRVVLVEVNKLLFFTLRIDNNMRIVLNAGLYKLSLKARKQ